MTAQIPDTVIHERKHYELVSFDGTDLPAPSDFGITTEPLHTGCYRGYYVTYRVTRGQLLLEKLTVRAEDGVYPFVHGISPIVNDDAACYVRIGSPVAFTGVLRLGRGFIEEMYLHLGFQKASSYREVWDLRFTEGRLVSAVDRSLEVKAIRDSGGPERPYDVIKFIDHAFSQDPEPLAQFPLKPKKTDS